MHASLIFSSTSASINVQKIFKIVLAKVRPHNPANPPCAKLWHLCRHST
jgi:hypothetical protein